MFKLLIKKEKLMNLETKLDLIQEPKDFLVLYHAGCLGGFASAYAAWLYFKDHNNEEKVLSTILVLQK